jgi:hypothetical protein
MTHSSASKPTSKSTSKPTSKSTSKLTSKPTSKRFFHSVAALVFTLASGLTYAQSTLADPVPILGDQGRSIAATAAMNSATNASARGNTTSPAEFARRKSHTAQNSACRKRALEFAPGSPQRKAVREQCKSTFEAQRATWYVKSQQAK